MRMIKNKLRLSIVTAAIAGFVAIPLYSYAIDYTTSGGSSTSDLGYTAKKNQEKKAYSAGAGLTKEIRKPENTPDFDQSPENIIAEHAAPRYTGDANSATKSYTEEEKKEECTPEDRIKLAALDKDLTQYASLMETSFNAATKLSSMAEDAVTKSMVSDAAQNANKAKKLISNDGFAKDFKLYKKCDTPLPDGDYLPLPKMVMELFQ